MSEPNTVGSSSDSRRPFTVCVEGSVGCGKSTFLEYCARNARIEVLFKPVSEWSDVASVNLLYPLRNYLIVSLGRVHRRARPEETGLTLGHLETTRITRSLVGERAIRRSDPVLTINADQSLSKLEPEYAHCIKTILWALE